MFLRKHLLPCMVGTLRNTKRHLIEKAAGRSRDWSHRLMGGSSWAPNKQWGMAKMAKSGKQSSAFSVKSWGAFQRGLSHGWGVWFLQLHSVRIRDGHICGGQSILTAETWGAKAWTAALAMQPARKGSLLEIGGKKKNHQVLTQLS